MPVLSFWRLASFLTYRWFSSIVYLMIVSHLYSLFFSLKLVLVCIRIYWLDLLRISYFRMNVCECVHMHVCICIPFESFLQLHLPTLPLNFYKDNYIFSFVFYCFPDYMFFFLFFFIKPASCFCFKDKLLKSTTCQHFKKGLFLFPFSSSFCSSLPLSLFFSFSLSSSLS